jgi:hypothetical protein
MPSLLRAVFELEEQRSCSHLDELPKSMGQTTASAMQSVIGYSYELGLAHSPSVPINLHL